MIDSSLRIEVFIISVIDEFIDAQSVTIASLVVAFSKREAERLNTILFSIISTTFALVFGLVY